jgi:hypothetical protein
VINRHLLPLDVIQEWPDVLHNIHIKAIPLYYVNILAIAFNDGKVWNIKVSVKNFTQVEQQILELIKEYECDINYIDFQLDIPRLKRDITKKTKILLKKK